MGIELYTEIDIDRIAGGADDKGEYAWAILKEEMYDAPENGNKKGEKYIHMVRRDIYDKDITKKNKALAHILHIGEDGLDEDDLQVVREALNDSFMT